MIKIIFLAAIHWLDPQLPPDSLRMETINGKVFIIHQIGERETLYAISKRYGTPITSILEFNNTADAGLEIGQILKIPYVPKAKAKSSDATLHKVAPKETLYSIAKLYNISVEDIKTWNNLKDGAISTDQELIVRKRGTASTPTTTINNVKGKHTVASGETLYSIARQYGVTVPQLMEWNKITGSELKLGDVLTVVSAGTEQKTQTATIGASKVTVSETKPIVEKENTIRISEAVTGSDEVKQSGLAELIEGTDGNRKYLALHRTAKVGTIMKVRNELNNREVFVRVIGTIPDTGINDKIVIKISKSAFDRLGAIDLKFRAEVTYYK
jgi:LysM repeat protein